MFYKALAQSVLLYGCETWTITPSLLAPLRGFHHRVARQITGKLPALQNGQWVIPPTEEALDAASLYPIEEYIRVRQRTLVDKIANRPLLTLCDGAERRSGSSPRRAYWWQQPTIVDLRDGQE